MPAPSAAPENMQGYSTGSTTVKVTWKAPPAVDQNGIIIVYNVSYQAVRGNYKDSTKRNKKVTDGSTQTDLTGLEEYVVYSISVSASTSAGEGPSSTVVTVRTSQAGKTLHCNIVRLLLFLLFSYIVRYIRDILYVR